MASAILGKRLNIGSISLPTRVILSPMVGVTDLPFRLLCHEGGAGLVVGEMLSSQAIHYQNKKTLRLLRVHAQEHPVSLQICGGDPSIMAEAARIIEASGADAVDINAGCPVPKVTKIKSGAALLKDDALFGAILYAVVKAIKIPATVKIRVGWNDHDLLAPALAKLAEQCGIAAVVVHARPVSKRHSGEPDLEGLRKVVENVKIPVFGNGGVDSPESFANFMERTGCAGASVGRATIGDPGIFRRCELFWTEKRLIPPPTEREKVETLLKHARLAAEFFGLPRGLYRLRKLVPYYVAGLSNATTLRSGLNKTATLPEWEERIHRFLDLLSAEKN